MKYIYIGEIVNTHGIKGELRILSDFKYKQDVFKVGVSFYIGQRKEKLVVTHYRTHKNFDMVTFEGIEDINEAIAYKGDMVYVNRDEIDIHGILNEDLIGIDVYTQYGFIGTIETVMKSNAHEILVILGDHRKHMVPYVDEFVKNINLLEHRMDIEVIEGLLNEN